jgi:hypothetical protein
VDSDRVALLYVERRRAISRARRSQISNDAWIPTRRSIDSRPGTVNTDSELVEETIWGESRESQLLQSVR